MIKVICFDLDDTLLEKESFDNVLWFEEVPRLYAKKHNLAFEEAQKKVFKEYDKIGPDSKDWYRPSFWFKYFEFEESWEDVLNDLKPGIKLFPNVKRVLSELHGKYKLIVLTQSSAEFIEMKMSVESISEYFDHVFSTLDDFDSAKKTPEVFQVLINKLGVKKHEIVHVGDSFEVDFKYPRKFGITAFFLSRKREMTGGGIIHSLTELQEELEKLQK